MCISGPPADGINLHVSFQPYRRLTARFLHVVFYPDGRLTVHWYKEFISGPPADSSLRVKSVSKVKLDERVIVIIINVLFAILKAETLSEPYLDIEYALINSSVFLKPHYSQRRWINGRWKRVPCWWSRSREAACRSLSCFLAPPIYHLLLIIVNPLTAVSRRSGYKFFVTMYGQPAVRIESYMKKRAVSRWSGQNDT